MPDRHVDLATFASHVLNTLTFRHGNQPHSFARHGKQNLQCPCHKPAAHSILRCLQVMHEPDVDYGSSCLNLTNCLGLVRDWHVDNPSHFPLTLFLNQKVDGLQEFLGDEGSNLLSAVMQTSTTPGPNT